MSLRFFEQFKLRNMYFFISDDKGPFKVTINGLAHCIQLTDPFIILLAVLVVFLDFDPSPNYAFPSSDFQQ